MSKGYRFGVLDNNVFSDDLLTQFFFIHVEIKSKKLSIVMPIFREQESILPYGQTKSILIRTCVCKVVQQLFIKYLINKLNTFSISKYAKTVNLCPS